MGVSETRGGERVRPQQSKGSTRMGRYRTDLTFRRITPEESRIYRGGAIVGEVHRQEDILNAGRHYYVIHLSEDHRGPVKVHERDRIRAEAQRLVDTHPLS